MTVLRLPEMTTLMAILCIAVAPRVQVAAFSSPAWVTSSVPNTRSFLETRSPSSRQFSSSKRMAVPVDHVLLGDLWTSSSTFLSDAATAGAETTDGGWWQSYINLFEQSLIFVHSTIDQPLRSMGVEQTWGPSIFLFTAGVRSLLLPLSIQQSKSTEYIKALKPYQDEIKERFKGNQDMQNRALAKLFEDAEANPLSGCLFSLAQIPVFLGLYRGVTLLARDGQLQEPFLWIPSLEGPVTAPTFRGMDWLTQGWTASQGVLPFEPSLGWSTTAAFLIMPIILVAGQYLTMKALSPAPDDTSSMSEQEKEQLESSQRILKFLPLMIGFFSLQVPAGLTIYWFTSNFFTLLQSLSVKAWYDQNPPEVVLPEYWDALDKAEEMSPEDKRKAAEAGLATGPSFEDMIDESRFHYVIERKPYSTSTQNNAGVPPAALAAWVQEEEDLKTVNGHAVLDTELTSAAATNMTVPASM